MTSIKTFVEVAKMLPARTSVMLRANHGMGKSQVVMQTAEDLGFGEKWDSETGKGNFIEKRLSQMTEGDTIGCPDKDAEFLGVKVTKFRPVDWIIAACKEPKTIFLDELNRATLEVMQSAFQLVLDRELNGHKLHPETRIYCAVNTEAQYTVNEIDPALLDRFWVCDLEPTLEDWIEWARGRGKIIDVIIDFQLQESGKFLDPPKNIETGKKSTSRRSWEALSIALKGAHLDENPHSEVFYHVCVGYVGVEAAIAFKKFAEKKDNRISGKEILEATDFEKVKKKIDKLGQEQWNICIDRVMSYVSKLETETLTDVQLENFALFMECLPDELRASMWAKTMQGVAAKRPKLARQVMKRCKTLVTKIFD